MASPQHNKVDPTGMSKQSRNLMLSLLIYLNSEFCFLVKDIVQIRWFSVNKLMMDEWRLKSHWFSQRWTPMLRMRLETTVKYTTSIKQKNTWLKELKFSLCLNFNPIWKYVTNKHNTELQWNPPPSYMCIAVISNPQKSTNIENIFWDQDYNNE